MAEALHIIETQIILSHELFTAETGWAQKLMWERENTAREKDLKQVTLRSSV